MLQCLPGGQEAVGVHGWLFWASEDRDLRETAYSSFAVLEVLEVGSGTPRAGPFGGVTVS